jgi:3-methylfumaryl-CoA hydratase
VSAIDVTALQTWVGRQTVAADPMTPFGARALAALLDHATAPRSGDALPLAWHWLYFLDAPSTAATGVDGHPRTGDFLPPVPLPRRMWAAGAVAFERPLRLGELAERRSTIVAIDAKNGKSGPLVFVMLEHCITQGGSVCVCEEQTLVYREGAQGPAPLPPGESAQIAADWSRSFVPSSVLLFRFSALTYNAHRIHYDREYATAVEFYPSLVVHGPLLLIQLLDLVERGDSPTPLASVRFRAVRPSFVDAPLDLRARRERGSIVLCSADEGNHVGMSAVATARGPT